MGDIRVGSYRVAIAIGPKNVAQLIKPHTQLNKHLLFVIESGIS